MAGEDDELECGGTVVGGVASCANGDAGLDESGPYGLPGGFGGVVLVA